LSLPASIGFIDFIDKLKLLLGIVQLVLPDSAIDHSNQWGQVALIQASGFLVSSIGTSIITLNLLLISNFCVEG
jgi:hypothetical protein